VLFRPPHYPPAGRTGAMLRREGPTEQAEAAGVTFAEYYRTVSPGEPLGSMPSVRGPRAAVPIGSPAEIRPISASRSSGGQRLGSASSTSSWLRLLRAARRAPLGLGGRASDSPMLRQVPLGLMCDGATAPPESTDGRGKPRLHQAPFSSPAESRTVVVWGAHHPVRFGRHHLGHPESVGPVRACQQKRIIRTAARQTASGRLRWLAERLVIAPRGRRHQTKQKTLWRGRDAASGQFSVTCLGSVSPP